MALIKPLPAFKFLFEKDLDKDIYIFYGSRSSSKSFHVALKCVEMMLTQPHANIILRRNRKNTIFGSQIEAIQKIIKIAKLSNYFKISHNTLTVTCLLNGNKAVGFGGDDPEKIKSLTDPTAIWFEEEIPTENDYITLISTLRGANHLPIFLTINPIIRRQQYQKNWLFQKYFANRYPNEKSWETEDAIVHQSTFLDNPYRSKRLIKDLESIKNSKPALFKAYKDGLWANDDVEGKAYYKFQYDVLKCEKTVYPTNELHVSFDFNVIPYITCTVWIIEQNTATQIDELLIRHPYANTTNIAQLLIERYKNTQKFYVYGDPSGFNRTTTSGITDFDIIFKSFADAKKEFFPTVLTAAYPVTQRVDWINSLFAGERNISLKFAKACQETILEYESVLMDNHGKAKLKERTEDGLSYEPFGHISDANDYFLTAAFQEDFINYLLLTKELPNQPQNTRERDFRKKF